MIIIVSHSSFRTNKKPISGTGAFLPSYFVKKKREYICLKFPISSEKFYNLETFDGRRIKNHTYDFSFSSNLLLKSIQELFLVHKVLFEIKQIDFAIGIDPLNSLHILLLSKLKRVNKIIFYTADYAEKRFDSKILNKIYHLIDAFVIKKADFVWNVSTRITSLRMNQGLSKNKNFFVPNSPLFTPNRIAKIKDVNRFKLIAVTTLSSSIDFDSIFFVLSKLIKHYKNVSLTIIGKGDWRKKFKNSLKKYNISKAVKFYEAMSYKKLLNLIKKSGIGIALYTDDNSWTYYCDSMKARDYLACGLPVIISSLSSTSDDIEKFEAGFSINNNFKDNLYKKLNLLLSNRKTYIKYRKNAIRLAYINDIEKILNKTFKACNIKI